MQWMKLVIPCLFFVVILELNIDNLFFSENSFSLQFEVHTKQNDNKTFVLKKFNTNTILKGKNVVEIEKASVLEVVKYDYKENKIMQPLFLLIPSFCFMVCVFYYSKYGLYYKKLTWCFMLSGLSFCLCYFFTRLQATWAIDYIKAVTNNEFEASFSIRTGNYLYGWIGFVLIWLGKIYNDAYKLTQQHDLTI